MKKPKSEDFSVDSKGDDFSSKFDMSSFLYTAVFFSRGDAALRAKGGSYAYEDTFHFKSTIFLGFFFFFMRSFFFFFFLLSESVIGRHG